MNISKALLICGAAFLASCGDYGLPYGNGDTKDVSEVDVPKENPADDLQLMFLGASLNNDKATNLVDLIASGSLARKPGYRHSIRVWKVYRHETQTGENQRPRAMDRLCRAMHLD